MSVHGNDSGFRALFESSRDAIFILTVDGYLDCNPRAVDMFGYASKDEVLVQHPADMSPPVQPDGRPSLVAANEHITTALREGMDAFEWMHRRKSGENFHCEVLLSAFDMGQQRVVAATVRDITRRRETERALQDSTEELHRFFNIALDMLCIADTDGYFRRLNNTWMRTLGWTREELMASRFLDFVHPDDVEATLGAIATLSEQNPVINFVNRYRCKDGSYRWIEWRSAPTGNLIYAAARDITEHIEAESTLRRMNELLDQRVAERTQQLQQSETELRALNAELERRVEDRTASLAAANKELEAFSYSVSHDLRAPLRHIGGFVQLLEQHAADVLDEKSRQWLKIVSDASHEMGQLIDDLLVFSRMGRTEMQMMELDVRGMVDDVRTALANEIGTRQVEWIVGPLPVVKADPSMLRLVFMNLMHNAVKYSRPREHAVIEIGAVEHPHAWEIFVRDNGAGFDMAYAEKLFGVFQRLHSVREFEGTGIGLANVHRIVTRHGGRVWAEGRVDEGATFHFTLPLPD
jgi:PAS domain S-box-containing protein